MVAFFVGCNIPYMSWFNVTLLIALYSFFHLFVIQFGHPWEKRTYYEKAVTVVATLFVSFEVSLFLYSLAFMAGEMGLDDTVFMLVAIYLAVHFLIIQFRSSWKERSLYEKIVSIIGFLPLPFFVLMFYAAMYR